MSRGVCKVSAFPAEFFVFRAAAPSPWKETGTEHNGIPCLFFFYVPASSPQQEQGLGAQIMAKV